MWNILWKWKFNDISVINSEFSDNINQEIITTIYWNNIKLFPKIYQNNDILQNISYFDQQVVDIIEGVIKKWTDLFIKEQKSFSWSLNEYTEPFWEKMYIKAHCISDILEYEYEKKWNIITDDDIIDSLMYYFYELNDYPEDIYTELYSKIDWINTPDQS